MLEIRFHAPRALRACLMAVPLLGALFVSGCATHYVDGTIKEVPAARFTHPERPRPVQLIAEFQTKGVPNARATAETRPMIEDSIRSAGLFSQVRDTPAPDAGVLSVTLNNVPLTDDAAARGFLAGLTLGVAGQQVTDGYVCTVSYLPPGQTRPVVKSARHAIHTTVGAHGAPENAYKASNIQDAVRTMVRQVMSVTLSDLSHDAAFK